MLPRMKYTHEIVGTLGGALLPERACGACSGSKIPRVYRPLLVLATTIEGPKAFVPSHVTDGLNTRDHITRGIRSRRS